MAILDVSSVESANWLYNFSWRGLLSAGAITALAAIATVIFSVLQFWSSNARDDFADKEKLELKAIAETARRQTAEINLELAKTSLKLEELKGQVGPRNIQREAFLKAINGGSKTSIEIVYLRDDPECFDVSQQIWQLLKEAHWDVSPPIATQTYIISALPTVMNIGGQPSGITLVTHSISKEEEEASMQMLTGKKDWKKTPWTLLNFAFQQGLGKVKGSVGASNSPKQGVIRIVVAPRV